MLSCSNAVGQPKTGPLRATMYEVADSLLFISAQFFYDALMYFLPIESKYNEPLAAVSTEIDNDR